MEGLTGLSDADDIVTAADGGNTELLYRGGNLVATELNVLGHGRVELGLLEGHDGLDAGGALLLQVNLGDAKCPGQQGNANEERSMKGLTGASQGPWLGRHAARWGRRSQSPAQGTRDRGHLPRHPSGRRGRYHHTRRHDR